MAEVIVAVPTFRRPQGLRRLLDALAHLETGADVRVLVADNDSERHEGLDACAALKDYRWPLDAFLVPERGIAQARNALVERALSYRCDFIAMLDDDEWPQPQWLDAFLKTQRETGADALHGDILRAFETKPGAWAARCDGVAPLLGARSGPIPMIEGSGNVFLSRACFERLEKPCFDPAFALSGGEDRDFFERLRRKGLRFAWSKEAVVHAFVPASRATLGWALKRAYRVGNSDMRVMLKHAHGRRDRITETIKIVAALLLFPLLFVLGAANGRAVQALRRLCRAAGKIAALRGRFYDEYAVTHGS
ncbi:MAG: glycosyltransferase [Alphaproteobacteria bacterium]|nr:glycosyltransferase [Alphaproteobacteria bacterium]MBV9693603.1 glycosyltransferase [Alphaproteobacteria bacterium]